MTQQTGSVESRPTDWTSSLSYQSKATVTPTEADLRELAYKAKKKNQSFGVTGILLYDKGKFFQTLEGPPTSIAALWSSISRDPRHTDVEILSEHIIPARLFNGWDLLSYDGATMSPEAMRKARAEYDLTRHVPDMIDLVLNGDDVGLNARIAALVEQGWEAESIVTHLIEPTARALGDAWLSDDCTELDLTIGLSMLQLAGHSVRHVPTPKELRGRKYSILLATAPGEPHALGTSLLADLYTDAGWEVDMVFPDSNQALMNQLASQQPDAMDIGLSDAMQRKDTLAKLRETIDRSRFAAPDNLTVISVGGRLFTDALATAENVGADIARKTTAGASVCMAELIRQKRQEPRG